MICFKTILKTGIFILFYFNFSQSALAVENYYSKDVQKSFSNLQNSQKANLHNHLDIFSLFQSASFKKLKQEFTKLLFATVSQDVQKQTQCPSADPCVINLQKKYLKARQLLFGNLHLKGSSKKTYAIDGVYCSRTFTNKDFITTRGLGPGQIPDHKILNTEHIWPQSHFSPRFPIVRQLIDLHILYPSHAPTNSQRGNHHFGEVAQDSHFVCGTARMGMEKNKQEVIFEPPNEYKGNVARAMFYFSVKYKMAIPIQRQRMFKRWNRLDPVDAFEQNRNEVIFAATNTRNPFIDQPKSMLYVSDFWGE